MIDLRIKDTEQELKELLRARQKSTDRQFIMDSFAYEDGLREIRENGISHNREVREQVKLSDVPNAEQLINELKGGNN